MKPFEGLTVIELAAVLAGPSVGMFFAELGARVIKVENRSNGGDMTRSWKLPDEDKNASISAYFSAVNYKKEYVDLDLRTVAGLERLKDLMGHADVFLNNMKSSSARAFGLDQKSLAKAYPKLIHCELSGFKYEEDKVAFDAVLQAETGFISMNGSPGRPAKLPVAFIDLFAAHQLKEAILIALIERMKDGKGSHIQCSLEESALAALANQASNQLMEGHMARPMGTLHPNIAPYGEIVSTKDGVEYILAIGTQVHFEGLCEILSRNGLTSDKRFVSNQERVKHRGSLHELLQAPCQEMSSSDFEQACQSKKVPVGRIRSLDEVVKSEAALTMRRDETIEGKPTSRLSSIAFQIERTT